MSMLTIERALEWTVCPRCHGPLVRAPDGLACRDPSCPCGGKHRFRQVAQHPVLIDPSSSVPLPQTKRRAGDALRIGVRRARPHPLRRLFTPPNRAAEAHAAQVRARLRSASGNGRLLVVGGGSIGNGAESLYEDPGIDVIAFDLYASPHTQFIADAHSIPLPDGSVQAVWIQAVLEHVLDPARVVEEIHRVLADGGVVYAETPFLQAVHEGAYDFTRFTESGHRWLFRRFAAIDSGVVSGPFLTLAWAIDYAVAGLLRSRLAGRAARAPLFWLPWLDRFVPAARAVDGASCVYFMGIKAADEIAPAEIVRHYQGAQR